MAEVLEAMGFPSEWCERALKSASGIEKALDLLLQWQAHGAPHFTLSSVRHLSPPPSSSGKNARHQQLLNSTPGRGPTLRLHPVSATASKAVMEEREQPPSSILLPSGSSLTSSSLDGPSGVNNPSTSDSPTYSFARTIEGPRVRSEKAPINQSEVTGKSAVEDATQGPEGGTASTRTVDNRDSSDAVVPDAFVPDAYAEERRARYLAARRAKQEKEEEKARIRQQMQEDMAYRRLRHSYQARPEPERSKSILPADQEGYPGGSNNPRVMTLDTAVELQIRCPGSQNIKATFAAGARLLDVREYVERQLQQHSRVLTSQDQVPGLQIRAGRFTGQSPRLSSDRDAERELLKAARENFEVQTNRILATAKTLRNSVASPDTSSGQNGDTIYFLIPFPRQEFFTELAMESTLVEAQLVPRGTLVVQFRQSEKELVKSALLQPGSSYIVNNATKASNSVLHNSHAHTRVAALVDESGSLDTVEPEADGKSPAFCPPLESGRTLEMEGERVRVRELALQAAAKRMTEAAKIFRAGLPLGAGENKGGFHFPTDYENHDTVNAMSPLRRIPLSAQVMTTFSEDNLSLNPQAPGADAGLSDEWPRGSDGSGKWPLDRPLDALHRQAMAAAEARIRSSQHAPIVLEAGYKQEPDEAESRVAQDELESRSVRARARIPESSRLLSRPEKLQRTSDSSPPKKLPVSQRISNDTARQMAGESSSPRQAQLATGVTSCSGPLEAALQRCKAASDGNSKGKGILEQHESPQVAMPFCSSYQAEAVRNSSLRVRLEDGNVVLHTFPADTMLESVRDSVVPEGAVASAYGFVVPFPEPHFVEGEALAATLEEVGLVPRGTIHLTKLASRGIVRQGRRVSRRRQYVEESDDDELMEGMFHHLTEHLNNRPELTYEELMDLEDSIGRVHVGVPEVVITSLPTHIVKTKVGAEGAAGVEELDLCIVCMAEMVDGEEALSLPCVHTFHTLCIRQWLLQSTCCPTCKHALV